ncbi:MAG: hypothetical protein SGPRY_004815 [Prymnesium sp.]
MGWEAILPACDARLCLLTSESRAEAWLWLSLARLRLDDALWRAVHTALRGAVPAFANQRSSKFDSRIWQSDDSHGWWKLQLELCGAMPGGFHSGARRRAAHSPRRGVSTAISTEQKCAASGKPALPSRDLMEAVAHLGLGTCGGPEEMGQDDKRQHQRGHHQELHEQRIREQRSQQKLKDRKQSVEEQRGREQRGREQRGQQKVVHEQRGQQQGAQQHGGQQQGGEQHGGQQQGGQPQGGQKLGGQQPGAQENKSCGRGVRDEQLCEVSVSGCGNSSVEAEGSSIYAACKEANCVGSSGGMLTSPHSCSWAGDEEGECDEAGGVGGICFHLTYQQKYDPGDAPARLARDAGRLILLSQRIRNAPEVAAHHYDRAAALLTAGLHSEAARDAESCLRLDPLFARAHFAKGRALYFLSEFEAAMTPLDRLTPTRTRWQYEAGLRLEPHPKIKAWLASEREKVEYISASSMGPLALTKLLSDAIAANDLSRLALLLARCPAHALDGGMYPRQPPLHMAAACGQIDCLALLLGRSASVSTLDADGRTALIVAVESGYSACACELLSHGADADAMCANGQPLLHKAALRGMGTCVSAILQRGGTISATDLHGRNAFHAGIGIPWPLCGEPIVAMSLLAASVERELEPSSFMDLPDAYGCTPALLAARCAYSRPAQLNGLLQCVSMCLQHGASALVSNMPFITTRSIVQFANVLQHLLTMATISALCPVAHTGTLHFSCPFQAASKSDGRTVLFFAVAIGAAELITQLLVLRKINPNQICARGLTPLHFAAAHGEPEAVRLLLAHRAQADVTDSNGATAIDHALRGVPGFILPGKGHGDCHALLLRHIVR